MNALFLIGNKGRGLTCILLLALLCAGIRNVHAQNTNFTLLDGKRSAEIPFTQVNNLIVVPVMLENRIPLWFILDTGVRTSILTDRMISDMLNMNYIRKFSLNGAGSLQQVEALLAQGISMKLPGLQVKGQQLLVLEEDYLELSKQLGMQVHGILGFEFFRRFVVKIDYDMGIITLIEPESFKPGRSFERVDLKLEGTKPYIECRVKTVPEQKPRIIKLMVDTGASHALLLHQEGSGNSFKLPENTLFGYLGRGLAGDIVGQIGRIDELSLDKFSFTDVLTSFPEDSAYNYEVVENRAGTMGGDLLSRFTVIFDYSGSALYLKKNAHYRDPFVFSRTGMDIIAVGQDLKSFRVVGVREESPAGRAGIQVGDELIKINGRKAKNLSLSHIIALFRKRNGKKINLKLKRQEQEYKTSFILQDII